MQNSQTAISDYPLNATATFLQEVKQSPSTVKLVSHSTQQIRTTTGTKNISIVKSPITGASSINTGTTTIYLPVFNTVRYSNLLTNLPGSFTSFLAFLYVCECT